MSADIFISLEPHGLLQEELSGNSNENRKFTTVTVNSLLLRMFAFRLLATPACLVDTSVSGNGTKLAPS